MKLDNSIVPELKLVQARLKKAALRYFEIVVEESRLKREKKKLHDESLAVLGEMEVTDREKGTTEQEWGMEDGRTLKARRYPISKVTWNIPAISKLLQDKGIAAHILKVEVDNTALELALQKGQVSLEAVKECVHEMKTTYGYRVDMLKKKEEAPAPTGG